METIVKTLTIRCAWPNAHPATISRDANGDLPRLLRSADERSSRHHPARYAAVRPLPGGRAGERRKGSPLQRQRADGVDRALHLGHSERGGALVLRFARRLHAPRRCERGRARHPRGVRLRVRVADGADESRTASGDRNDLHAAGGRVHLRLVAPRQRSLPPRRRRGATRSADGVGVAEGAAARNRRLAIGATKTFRQSMVAEPWATNAAGRAGYSLRGSNASRNLSPMMLKAATVRKIATPGKRASHQAYSMNCLAEARMLPQVAVGSGTPRPRNESADSVRIA